MSTVYKYALKALFEENPELFMKRLEILCENSERAYCIFEPHLTKVHVIDEVKLQNMVQSWLNQNYTDRPRTLTEITSVEAENGQVCICYKYDTTNDVVRSDSMYMTKEKLGDAIQCEFV